MKTNALAKLICAVALCLASGLVGASAALHFVDRFQAQTISKVVRTQRLEVVGQDGKEKALLGYDDRGVYLRLLSARGTPLLSLVVLEETAARNAQAATMGSLAPQYPYGTITLNDAAGREVVRISAPTEGHGQISFASPQSSGKLTLGYFPVTDSSDGNNSYGVWGLRVLGRIDGRHIGTGVGLFGLDGTDTGFLAPETSRSEKSPVPLH